MAKPEQDIVHFARHGDQGCARCHRGFERYRERRLARRRAKDS